MTVVDEDRTSELLTVSEEQDASGAWISDAFKDHLKVTREYHELLVKYGALLRDEAATLEVLRSLRTPAGVVKYFSRLSTADQQIVLAESGVADRHGLELAHQRAEVRKRIEALGLSKEDTDAMTYQLLDSPGG